MANVCFMAAILNAVSCVKFGTEFITGSGAAGNFEN